MPGYAEWSCFKASLHDHLILEIFLIVIILSSASYTSILFFFYKKNVIATSRKSASPAGSPIVEGTATEMGVSLEIGPAA